MSKIKVFLILFLALFVFSCKDDGTNISFDSNIVPDYSDPDPVISDELISAPDDVFIVLNVSGELRAFLANNPTNYEVLVTDVCTEQYFEEIRLSNNKSHLLYVNSDKDLILYNISEKMIDDVIQEDVSCNETQFIDNDCIQYSHSSNIYCYTISADPENDRYLMINDTSLHCNHGAVVSPNGNKIVFKNQVPGENFAVYAWAEVTGETVESCIYLGDYSYEINLLESFEFVWIDNDIFFMKPSAELNQRIKAYNLTESIPQIANVVVDGAVIQYSELTISEDRSKLCIYGDFGLYQVDISTIDFDNFIVVNEIYSSDGNVTTPFAAYDVNSEYLVAATSGCINIYKADTLNQVDFDSTEIISEGDVIYSLDCK